MSTQAEILRNNRARDAAQQVAASNYGEPEVQELANGIPAGSNDAALAAHLEEWRAKDVSYQRAQNQEARDQIEAAYVASQNRLNAAKQEIKDRANLEKHQQNQIDNSAGERLALQMEELVSTFPMDWRPETLPMDKLRQLTDLRHQVQTLAAATGQPGLADGVLESGPLSPANVLGQLPNGPQAQAQARPQTFPDGSLYQFQHLPDGDVEVRLITGEVFRGSPIDVTRTIAESNVRTKLWARGKRPGEELPAAPPSTAEPMQLNQPTAQLTGDSLADDLAARQADSLARQFGLSSKEELMQWGETVNQKMAAISQYEDERLASEFLSRCQDFPSTLEASEAITNIVQNNGWQWNADSLQAAHLLAVQNHVYEPIRPEQPQVVRQAPPPMLRTNNPEISNAALSPYDMSLGDLRKAAIKQELDRNSEGYR